MLYTPLVIISIALRTILYAKCLIPDDVNYFIGGVHIGLFVLAVVADVFELTTDAQKHSTLKLINQLAYSNKKENAEKLFNQWKYDRYNGHKCVSDYLEKELAVVRAVNLDCMHLYLQIVQYTHVQEFRQTTPEHDKLTTEATTLLLRKVTEQTNDFCSKFGAMCKTLGSTVNMITCYQHGINIGDEQSIIGLAEYHQQYTVNGHLHNIQLYEMIKPESKLYARAQQGIAENYNSIVRIYHDTGEWNSEIPSYVKKGIAAVKNAVVAYGDNSYDTHLCYDISRQLVYHGQEARKFEQ